jgi:hypothetical protein
MNYVEIAYIESLTDKEKKAYDIARSHLGSSFDLSKSSGFIKWKTTYVVPSETPLPLDASNRDLKSR